jgi:hypothetical protein
VDNRLAHLIRIYRIKNEDKKLFKNCTYVFTARVHKPVLLTTFNQSDLHYYISLDNNDLTTARDGQNTPAKSGQGQWLLQHDPEP